MGKEYWSSFDRVGWDNMNEINTKITGLHPKVADAIAQTLNEAKARGLNVGLFSGVRTDNEKQEKLYALGRTVKNEGVTKDKPMGLIVTNAKTIWDTFHGFGLAGDIVYKDEKGNWTWDKTPEQWEELGKIGEMFGLTWGGRWKFKDYPHFQMTGKILNTKQAKEILDKEGVEVLYSKLA